MKMFENVLTLQDARSFSQAFFAWYNDEHRHSGLGLLAPAVVHYALAPAVIEQRRTVLEAAYRTHPERFVRKPPQPRFQIGGASTSLQLRLYAFDGTSIRTVWKRNGLVGGKVSVSGAQVTLEHEKAYHSNDPRVTETLYVTPNGLE